MNLSRALRSPRKRAVASGLAASLALIGIAQPVLSACLDLALPTPKTTNVCERLTEELFIPPVFREERRCQISGFQCFFLPHCCVPGACLTAPSCYVTERVLEAVGYWLHAGDLYCDLREIDPEEMISKLKEGLYPDIADLVTGGLSSIFYQAASAHIDIMECSADGLNNTLKDVIWELMRNSPFPEHDSFFSVDLDRVNIINRSFSYGSLYLREGYDGITLDSLVILKDELYTTLASWDKPWDAVKFGRLNSLEELALTTMIHELVHVRQYRNMTREKFINTYLVEYLRTGYEDIPMEREADAVEEWAQAEYESTKGLWTGFIAVSLHN
jgi:hypothetical protein